MADEIERIPQHRHCATCGNAHTRSERYCSDACKENKKSEITKKKRRLFILWIAAAAPLILILVGSLMGYI
jgi:Uncharacterized protein containing a Zn-ribbon